MILKLEIEAEDALELLALHAAVQELAVLNIGNDPIGYSKMSRITNAFFMEVIKRLPLSEFERIKNNSQ